MSSPRPIFDPDRMAAREDADLVPRTMTVAQLTAAIKRAIGAHLPPTIHLIGEISNYSRHSSGHVYLTLKDDRSEIKAVMWRSAAQQVKFKVEDGMQVVATGHVDVYEPRGQCQFYIRRLEPRGAGALDLAFRQLHDKLKSEGLFDPARKRPAPRYPRRIAVVTSPTGAAIRDILQTLQRRWPCAAVLVYPVRVQGEGAAAEIAAAVQHLNEKAASLGGIDVMLVARGGGSLEDLWAFNEEVVARAIFASGIPIISGVGHEVDVTIADLVADVRAPTPTAAAELATPVLADVIENLAGCEARLRRNMRHRLDLARSQVEAARRAELFRSPIALVRRAEQHIDELTSRLRLACTQRLAEARRRVHELEIELAARRPSVLLREHHDRLLAARYALEQAIRRRWRMAERRIAEAERRLLSAAPARRLATEEEKLRQWQQRLDYGMKQAIERSRQRLVAATATLDAVSYHRTLARGFTVTWDADKKNVITRADGVHPGQHIITETTAGDFGSRVEDPPSP